MTKKKMIIELYKRIYKARREMAYFVKNFGETHPSFISSKNIEATLVAYADAIEASPVLKKWYMKAWEEGEGVCEGDTESFSREVTDADVSEGLKNISNKEYNPNKQYVVNREDVGRPRRILTEQERQSIMKLREEGKPINNIAKELGLSNRLVMRVCQEK